MERKHIVFIVDYFYPNYSANGICVKKIIDVLKKTHRVTVICIKNQEGLSDIEEYNSMKIIRITIGEYCIRNYVNSLQRKPKSKFKKAISVSLLRIVQVRRYLKAIFASQNVMDNFVKGYVQVLREIEGPIDLIVPACFPFESIVAALEFKKIYNNSVKIKPYLFDKFSVSKGLHRTEWNRKLKMQKHLMLEKMMLDKCDSVLATDDWEIHLKEYFSDYIEKIKFVDIPALCIINKTSLIQYEDGKIHFVYTGALDQKIRPPEYALELFSRCIADKPEYVLHMYVWGNCGSIVNKFVEHCPRQINNHGRVSLEISHSAISNADILFSIGNTDITQKPSKIYEYMACGKPIIHLYHDQNDPVISILNKYGRACCLEQSEMKAESNRMEFIRFVEAFKEIPVIPFEQVKNKFLEATPEYTVKILEGFIE